MTSENPSITFFDRERKRKQDYLKATILQGEFDPEHFSTFLMSERTDGQNIDNWNYEELETMVGLYKRKLRSRQPDLDLHFKLEDIELNDEKTAVYVKRVETAKRSPTLLSTSKHTVKIRRIDILEGGFFYGKSLAFDLLLYPSKVTVIRSEEQFKWLQETIALEFPQTIIPPLTKVASKNYDDESLKLYGYYYERFLNELAGNKELKYSLALDNFLKCRSKEELDIKRTEIEGFIRRNILLERNLTKKKFDGLTQNPLVLYPTPQGNMILKISHTLKSHFVNADLKFGTYDMTFERMDKVAEEFDKAYKRLIKATDAYKDLVVEMGMTAEKYNGAKQSKYAACISEEMVFGSVATFLDHQSYFIRQIIGGRSGNDAAKRIRCQQIPERLLFFGPGRDRPT